MSGIVNLVFQLFYLLVLARILISYVQLDPSSPIVQFLHNTTEPFLAPIRRLLPPTAGFDFSPLVLIVIAVIIRSLIGTALGI
jgi:YggT family protein